MNSSATSRPLNTALGFLAIALWSTSVALGRNVTKSLGPMTAGAIVYLVGGFIGSLYLLASGGIRQRIQPQQRRYLIICGTLFVSFCAAFYIALSRVADDSQAVEVGLVNYLWPTLTLVFSLIVLPLRAKWWFVPGVIMSMTGVVLAMNQRAPLSVHALAANLHSNPSPYILALVGAIAWAWYSVLSRSLGNSSARGSVPVFMLSAGIVMICARFFLSEQSDFHRKTLFELAAITLASNSAYVFWDYAMRRGDIVLVVAASYFAPLLSTLFTCLYLYVAASPRLWIACLLVLGGAIVCKLSMRELITRRDPTRLETIPLPPPVPVE